MRATRWIPFVLLALVPASPAGADSEGAIEGTALDRHCAFFDADADGFITIEETRRGLVSIGVDRGTSTVLAVAITTALATKIDGRPSTAIDLAGIERATHGSHSGIYDDEGRFRPDVFERWFDRWDTDRDGALDYPEFTRRLGAESEPGDLYGIAASAGEFTLLFLVAAEEGKLTRERLRAAYDGSLFYQLAEERRTRDGEVTAPDLR